MHTGIDTTFYLFMISVGLHKKCIIFILPCFILFLLFLNIHFATSFLSRATVPSEMDGGFTVLCIAWTVALYVAKVRELIAVKVLHTSLLNTTVVAFKILPLGSYASMPASSSPFKTILELVLCNGLQSCRCITPDVIKMHFFKYILYLREQKKVKGG